MTCIVGLARGGEVHIGADSASASGWTVRRTKLRKVFRSQRFIIGYTTSFRMGQILQYHLDVRDQKKKEGDEEYMVSVFVKAVRDCLKAHGFAKIENQVEEGGDFLVGYRSQLYRVASDFQINRAADGIDACGCGEQYALGAMMALSHLQPRKRIREALSIAAYFSGAVMPPFRILKVKSKT